MEAINANGDIAAEQQLSVHPLGTGEMHIALPERYFADPLFGAIYFRPEWCWVAERAGEIIGYLFAPPAEGGRMVTLMRLKMDQDAPEHAMLVLLRQFFRDAGARGIQGTYSHFDPTIATEWRLADLMLRRFGGRLFLNVCAPMPKKED